MLADITLEPIQVRFAEADCPCATISDNGKQLDMVDEDEEGTVLVSGLLNQKTTLTLSLTKASEPGNQREAYVGVCVKGCCDEDEAPNTKGGWMLSSDGVLWADLEKSAKHHSPFHEPGTELQVVYSPATDAAGSNGGTVRMNRLDWWLNGEMGTPVIGIDSDSKGVCFCVGKDGGEYSWEIMDKPKYRGEPKLSTVFLEVAQPGEDD
jgi:hypothetical protein